jgi:hypothetical protein
MSAAGYVTVSGDGTSFYSQFGMVYSSTLTHPDQPMNPGQALLASAEAGYFFSIPDRTIYGGDPHVAPPSGGIYLQGQTSPLLSLPPMPEMNVSNPGRISVTTNDFTEDKRYVFVPSLSLFETIPHSNDRIVVRKLDVKAQLDHSGVSYLFVSSAPPSTYLPGKDFSYTIKVESKSGGVTYRLETGPSGMSVSPQGVVNWKPSKGFLSMSTPVVISVKDSSGQSVYHSFNLTVSLQ